ncbi:translation initiation factor IF-3, mitochondrial [Poecilia latipinna]|uniref:Mitochondrial translational initiation factor 3 n=2 Tax=Poecilia TaxID=8080 RepID=A0A087YEL8_POEFO|nr:PREDICTED: translation initiation factor IF-3, mitochondrial [Poecilia formosa]XP_014906769.1 PREDICTED: translation initiation factor IF-3, mitochondrial [Poecilia latipinna]XP_014906770.1 PREDICTED: translation initiation factor IF-3, mitochondrial [Poecilia latipinna]
MSAGRVRWLLGHTVRAMCGGSTGPGYWTPALTSAGLCERHGILSSSWRRSAFSTEVPEETPTPAVKKKKQDPHANASISSVGRKIPHREIQVIDEDGENLGLMHRADVIRIINEKNLKLVLLKENKEPPLYQLMSGKHLHEEQLRLREKNKAKASPTQVKELSFSVGIASHDLSTKLKQAESWLEKKHHVRLTLRGKRHQHNDNLDKTLEEMVEQMNVMTAFVSTPKVTREGQVAMCVLRPPSAKELAQKAKTRAEEPQPEARKTLPVSNTDTTEEAVQQ